MRAIGEPAGNLARFMARHGHSRESLLAELGPNFADLDLVVGTGSIVVGYANARSDLDLYAVGKVPDTQRVPLVSHARGSLIDISLLDADELAAGLHRLTTSPYLLYSGGALADDWKRTHRLLTRAIRLAYGVPLAGTPDWTDRQAALREGWLGERAVAWWRMEALRRLLTARWTAESNPRLAARMCAEARLAALKAVTAREGFLYLHQKWVSTELKALGRDDLLALYRSALTESWDASAVRVDETADLVADLVGEPPPGLLVEVSYVPGVSVHPLGGGHHLLSRWEMRGVVLDAPSFPKVRRGGRAVWTGLAAESPPDAIHQLVLAGLAWVGVCHGED